MRVIFAKTLKILGTPPTLYAVLLVVPLFLAVVWGTPGISDDAYINFHIAEAMAEGHPFPYSEIPGQPHIGSPLFTVFLFGAAAVGLPLPLTALIFGALLWSLACVAVFDLGRSLGMPVAGIVAAGLLAFGRLPVTLSALATEVPWLLCLVWWAIDATMNCRWRLQLGLLVLLLAARLDLTILSLVVFLVGARFRAEGRIPWDAILAVFGVLMAWGVAIALDLVVFSPTIVPPRAWRTAISALLDESEFYWFGLPLAAVGCVTMLGSRRWFAVNLWVGMLILGGPEITGILASSILLWWLGIGVASVARWLGQRTMLRLSREAVIPVVALLVTSPLLVSQTMSLVRDWSARLTHHQVLVSEAAAWIRDRTAPGARLMGSARIGYLAERPMLFYAGETREAGGMSSLIANMQDDPPEMCVSYRSLAWDDLQRTGWFQNTYYAAAVFFSDYDSLSPIKVWLRRPEVFDLGVYEPLSVRLPNGSAWVGYTYEPDRVIPGDTVSVTLFLYAPPAVADGASTTNTNLGQGSVYLQSPVAGGRFGQSDGPAGRKLVIDDPEIGRVWAETYLLPTPRDLSIGAYYLSASLVEQNSGSFSDLYQDEIVFPIDRVTLGYVVVPWHGDLSAAIPVGATLDAGKGEACSFTLLGYEISGDVATGGSVDVTLFWEAQDDMRSATDPYFIFVHLLDSSGQLVAQHDGPPMAGQYPLAAWIPGEPVPDSHTLFVDPALPAGTYSLQAGVYTWPTLERLPAWDADANRLPDDVVRLGTVIIN